MPEQRYIATAPNGWLNVKREPSGAIIALPEFLRVAWESATDGRDHFVVGEGVEAGSKCSVKIGNLKTGNPGYRGPARLEYILSKKELIYQGGRAPAITSSSRPVPIGSHPIQIPDFPHAGGAIYAGQSPYAKSWFYLGRGHALPGSSDRYLHTGTVSDGCITVDPSQWSQLYRYLVLCRSSDGQTVGSVTVVR